MYPPVIKVGHGKSSYMEDLPLPWSWTVPPIQLLAACHIEIGFLSVVDGNHWSCSAWHFLWESSAFWVDHLKRYPYAAVATNHWTIEHRSTRLTTWNGWHSPVKRLTITLIVPQMYCPIHKRRLYSCGFFLPPMYRKLGCFMIGFTTRISSPARAR